MCDHGESFRSCCCFVCFVDFDLILFVHVLSTPLIRPQKRARGIQRINRMVRERGCSGL